MIWFVVKLNDQPIGLLEIQRRDHLDLTDTAAIADVVSTYTVCLDRKEVAQVRHRYGDGMWLLVQAAVNAAIPARQRAATSPVGLSAREVRVLHGMAAGQSNKEIGLSLSVAEDTVKSCARRLFRKLGANDRAHAVARGFEHGILGSTTREAA